MVVLNALQCHPNAFRAAASLEPAGIGQDDRIHLHDLSQRRKIRPEVRSPSVSKHRNRDSNHVLPRCVEAQ